MKFFALVLFVVIIFAIGILAPSFLSNVSEQDTSIAKKPAVQESQQEAKAPDQAAEEQPATAKNDSFTVGKVLDEKQGDINTLQAMVDRGKNYLLKQVDNRLKQLEPFKTRVENMTALSDSDRNGLVSELKAIIDAFEAFKPEISRSATKQDIRNVADKIKAEWLKSRLSVERAEGQILAAKENQLILDAGAASVGIQKRIDVLKASGKGAKAYEELLSDYDKKIASAKQDMESAKEKFEAAAGAATDDEKNKLIREKELLSKSAHDNIKEAYGLLKDEARQEFARRYK